MMPAGLKYVLKALNYFFTAVFTLEAAMKLIALGVRRFFSERSRLNHKRAELEEREKHFF